MESFVPPNPAGIWGGQKLFPWEKRSQFLQLNYNFTTNSMELDPDVGGWNSFAYVQAYDTWFCVAQMRHISHTNASTWPEAFQPYQELEGVPQAISIDIQPVSNVTLEIAKFSPSGYRNIYGTFTYRPSVELEVKILNILQEEASPVKNMTGFLPGITIQPISYAAIEIMKKRGGNALGLADKANEGPLMIINTSWAWKDASDDERSYAAYYRFLEKAETTAKEMGVWHPYKYVNYAEATQDVWSGVGEENLRELRRMQRIVDPEGVFTKGGLASRYLKLNELPEGERERRRSGVGWNIGGRPMKDSECQ
ncbi:hypothetical protein GJ744_009040 [Endocarpon pusillum]|uniref:Berberine/berberine-like domain-containing protein n=1 Tax=Endocarpon pusillum TaxID=364733 RepID=A0A8H7E582_9EURO|nr:hypothetical protein GJ744_009040 [Endocarpon pusillum]